MTEGVGVVVGVGKDDEERLYDFRTLTWAFVEERILPRVHLEPRPASLEEFKRRLDRPGER